jgi:hydroxymethylpyrimidine kinase/phosphomethylpyrimidine kinase
VSARHGPRGFVLCVGGFDPSGGAGIVADLRGASAAGGQAVAILAALTAQSSARVFEARAVPRGWVRSQIDPLASEAAFGAVKTGLFASSSSIAELAAWYRTERGRVRAGPIVVDPVFASGDGTRLATETVWRSLVRDLIPLAFLVTPNRAEAEKLSGVRIAGRESMERAARRIVASESGGPSAVLLKGGHVPGPPADLLWDGKTARWLPSAKRLPGRWHGLGCHLASMIAVRLAIGDPLPRAVSRARALLARGMRGAVVTPSGRLVPSWHPGRNRG